MKKTLFVQYVEKWFKVIAGKITETINGKKDEGEALKYLHESMLTPEYSADLTWDSSSLDGSVVAADVVAMDSPLPLKKRDKISTASGKVPKLGMKMWKGEKLITDINIMAARGAKEAQIVAKLFSDAPRCATGIKERLEIMFLQALSTGYTIIPDEENVGTGIRINFKFLTQNKFKPLVKWGQKGYQPLTDIVNVISQVEDTITVIMVSKKGYNLIRTSTEAKWLTANYRGLVITDEDYLPMPTPSQFNEAVKDEHGIEFMIVDRTVKIEKDGKRKNVKPFHEDAVVFLTSADNVGRLVYGTLAEETNPVEDVKYEKVGEFILLSKYSKNDPLREFTASQALVLPVIDNVDSIYLMDNQDAQETDEDEDDDESTGPADPGTTDPEFELFGGTFTKTELIDALRAIGETVAHNIGDQTLIDKINALEPEKQELLKQELGITGD